MVPTSVHHGPYRLFLFVCAILVGLFDLLTPSTLRTAQPDPAFPSPAQSGQSTERSRMDLGMPPNLQSPTATEKSTTAKTRNLEEMKTNVAALADLVNSLKDDLNETKPDQLPAGLTEKVEQINKLAKHIEKVNGKL